MKSQRKFALDADRTLVKGGAGTPSIGAAAVSAAAVNGVSEPRSMILHGGPGSGTGADEENEAAGVEACARRGRREGPFGESEASRGRSRLRTAELLPPRFALGNASARRASRTPETPPLLDRAGSFSPCSRDCAVSASARPATPCRDVGTTGLTGRGGGWSGSAAEATTTSMVWPLPSASARRRAPPITPDTMSS
eukprot:scaffold211916_cov31-Tisochrysis_lutea.AAC.1